MFDLSANYTIQIYTVFYLFVCCCFLEALFKKRLRKCKIIRIITYNKKDIPRYKYNTLFSSLNEKEFKSDGVLFFCLCVQAPEGQAVYLEFDDMHIEYHGTCMYDYVELYVDADESAPLVGRYCGSETPRTTFQSTDTNMFVLFLSDKMVADTGFKASFYFSVGEVVLSTIIVISFFFFRLGVNIGFPGQFRNFVDQINFMSIQFRRFGSCTTDSSFDFIFPAFEFVLTPIKSKFMSFKFAKNASSSQNGHSI